MIYQNKKSDVWYMDFVVEGKRTHRTCKTKTKKDAQVIHDQAKQDIISANILIKQQALVPTWMKPVALSLSEARDRMYDEQWSTLKDSESPKRHITYIISIIGDIPDLREVGSPQNINAILQSLQRKNLSYKTINRYLTSLRSLLRRSLNVWYALDKEPHIKEYMKDEVRSGRIRVYTNAERSFIYNYFTDNSHDITGLKVRDFIEVLFYTGMRRGELLGATLRDLVLYPLDQARVVSYENKESAVKAIPLVPEAARLMEKFALMTVSTYLGKILAVHPAELEEEAKIILSEVCTDSNFMSEPNQPISSYSGEINGVRGARGIRGILGEHSFKECLVTSLSKGQVEYHWKKLKKETYLGQDDQAVMHSIRHTFATKLIGTGATLYEVQHLLGHKSSKTTETYAHLQVDHLRKTAMKTTQA